MKNLTTKKTPGSENFEFTMDLREVILISHKLFQSTEEEVYFPIYSMKPESLRYQN